MTNKVIELKNLSKHYPVANKEFYALKNISVDFKEGEFSGIVGPSGSGKTTMLNIIGSLDTPSKGSALVLDKNISTLTHSQSAKLRNHSIGFIFQVFKIYKIIISYFNLIYL